MFSNAAWRHLAQGSQVLIQNGWIWSVIQAPPNETVLLVNVNCTRRLAVVIAKLLGDGSGLTTPTLFCYQRKNSSDMQTYWWSWPIVTKMPTTPAVRIHQPLPPGILPISPWNPRLFCWRLHKFNPKCVEWNEGTIPDSRWFTTVLYTDQGLTNHSSFCSRWYLCLISFSQTVVPSSEAAMMPRGLFWQLTDIASCFRCPRSGGLHGLWLWQLFLWPLDYH